MTAFARRAQYGVKFRRAYPTAVLLFAQKNLGLEANARIVDLGSGSGWLTRSLLRKGHTVYAVEPDPLQRFLAEAALSENSRFVSISGTAEKTTLKNRSVDWAVAGRAFQCFRPELARKEIRRITVHPHRVLFIEAEMPTRPSAFMQEYRECLLKARGTKANQGSSKATVQAKLRRFFGSNEYKTTQATQETLYLSKEGLIGRTLSSPWIDELDARGETLLLKRLSSLFFKHQKNGRIPFCLSYYVTSGHLRK
jgi:SAM-dependent methyltransferase